MIERGLQDIGTDFSLILQSLCIMSKKWWTFSANYVYNYTKDFLAVGGNYVFS